MLTYTVKAKMEKQTHATILTPIKENCVKTFHSNTQLFVRITDDYGKC